MKGIPNRQKKSVIPKRDYIRAKQDLLRKEFARKREERKSGPGAPSGADPHRGGDDGTASD